MCKTPTGVIEITSIIGWNRENIEACAVDVRKSGGSMSPIADSSCFAAMSGGRRSSACRLYVAADAARYGCKAPGSVRTGRARVSRLLRSISMFAHIHAPVLGKGDVLRLQPLSLCAAEYPVRRQTSVPVDDPVCGQPARTAEHGVADGARRAPISREASDLSVRHHASARNFLDDRVDAVVEARVRRGRLCSRFFSLRQCAHLDCICVYLRQIRKIYYSPGECANRRNMLSLI